MDEKERARALDLALGQIEKQNNMQTGQLTAFYFS